VSPAAVAPSTRYMRSPSQTSPLEFGLGRLVPDQVPPQEGGDEAVGLPEAEAPAEARVRDAAAQVAARRGAAHERDRVGARRDARHDVEPERRRLVPPPPPPTLA